MTSQNDSPLNPKIVLGIAAHPDDLDFPAGGTLARFAAGGASVHMLILTDGSKGSADYDIASDELIQTRKKEQQAAADALGVASVEFLSYRDGELEITMELKQDIVRSIRKLRPDVVVTLDPTEIYTPEIGSLNHPDHRAAGQATLDAVYPLARDHLSFPGLLKEGLEPHKVATVLLINFGRANHYVDITDTLQAKMEAIKAHASQTPDVQKVQAVFTGMAAAAGQASGHQYAEGFMRIDVRA